MIIGKSETRRTRRHTSIPDMNGSIKSRISISIPPCSARSQPVRPSLQTSTSYPSCISSSSRKRAICVSSSTIRIFSGMPASCLLFAKQIEVLLVHPRGRIQVCSLPDPHIDKCMVMRGTPIRDCVTVQNIGKSQRDAGAIRWLVDDAVIMHPSLSYSTVNSENPSSSGF